MRIGRLQHEWMVGLCDRDHCRGALQVAKWLGAHGPAAAWGVRGVHVMVGDESRDDVPAGHASRRALGHIAELVTEAGAASCMEGIEFVAAESAEDGLRDVAQANGVHGIVIGRPPRTDESHTHRLGSTARRLLRDCDAPLVVAAPEMDLDDLLSGPVLVGVALDEHCAHATTWARWLARALDRPLQVVHVVEVPDVGDVDASEGSIVDPRVVDALRSGEELLRDWQGEYGLEDVDAEAMLGVSPARRLLAHALVVGACAIVCGTRHPAFVERFSLGGVSAELAYASRWPVVVVPPPPPALAETA